ncbi:MAG: EamA family transporter, partial [Caldithrix sp.]|nr:EamA family transporter [Caldithrix sp.]
AVFLDIYALRYIKQLNGKVLRHGAVIGALLYFSYLFQMWGINYTTASNAAFITALSVVLVPVLGLLFFGIRAEKKVVLAVFIAVIGLLLLTGGNPLNWNKGDGLVLICSITVAFHIIYTGRFAPLHNFIVLTAVQLTTVSLLSMLALPFSPVEWPDISPGSFAAMLYLGLFGTVYTYIMQTAMQRYTTTARTALVFSMEPVFAAFFAYIIANEQLGWQGWLGGLLIVGSVLITEVPYLRIHHFFYRKS